MRSGTGSLIRCSHSTRSSGAAPRTTSWAWPARPRAGCGRTPPTSPGRTRSVTGGTGRGRSWSPRSGLLEVGAGLAVVGALLPEPGVELAVVPLPLVPAVGAGVVAQVEL